MNIQIEKSYCIISTETHNLIMSLGEHIDYNNLQLNSSIFLNLADLNKIKPFFTTPINKNRYMSLGTKKLIDKGIHKYDLIADIFSDKKRKNFCKKAYKELDKCKILQNEKSIKIKDFTITPFMESDNSYLLLIQSNEEALIWTFYYNGVNTKPLIDKMMRKVGNKKIDYIITSSNLSNDTTNRISSLVENNKKIFLICDDLSLRKKFCENAIKNNIQCYAPWTECDALDNKNVQELLVYKPDNTNNDSHLAAYKAQRRDMKNNFLAIIGETKPYKELIKEFKGQDVTIISVNSNSDILSLGEDLGFNIIQEDITKSKLQLVKIPC